MPTRYLHLDKAAEYLEMSVRALRDHLYKQKDLQPDGINGEGRLLFSTTTLDQFRRRKRRRGRPPVDY